MKGYDSSGNVLRVIKYNEDSLLEKIPPAIYRVAYNDSLGFFLTKISDRFDLEDSILYIDDRVDKVVDRYTTKNSNLGILLSGLKGAGKSYFMKYTSNKLIDLGYPVITINEAYAGDSFNEFLYDLESCVILFDEFGKVYPKNGDSSIIQDDLLSLFDGMFQSSNNNKKLYMLSENDINSISNYFLDRPGRVHYHFRYNTISNEIILEFLDKKTKLDDESKKIVVKECNYIMGLSFDVLNSVIEEINFFNYNTLNREDLTSLLKDLNIDYFGSRNKTKINVLKVELKNNKTITPKDIIVHTNKLSHNSGFWIDYLDSSEELYINPEDLIMVDDTRFLYDNENIKILLEEVIVQPKLSIW